MISSRIFMCNDRFDQRSLGVYNPPNTATAKMEIAIVMIPIVFLLVFIFYILFIGS